MADDVRTFRCKRCQEATEFHRRRCSHILHLILSIVTGGLWLPVWLFSAVRPRLWTCCGCGGH